MSDDTEAPTEQPTAYPDHSSYDWAKSEALRCALEWYKDERSSTRTDVPAIVATAATFYAFLKGE